MNLAAENAFAPQMLAHDLKSPLQALVTLVESTMDYMNQEQVILFQKAKGRAEELLIHYKRKKAGKKHFNIKTAIYDIFQEKKATLEDKNIKIKLNSNDHWLNNDKIEFQRIISNLIDNSIEAIENQGGISVNISQSTGNLKIHVRDTGKGIDDITLMRILKHGGSFGKKSGSGLGLTHAKMIMKRWGGKLEIDSLKGHGTVVTLIFPLSNDPKKGHYFLSE